MILHGRWIETKGFSHESGDIYIYIHIATKKRRKNIYQLLIIILVGFCCSIFLGVTYYKSIATSAIHPATPFWVFKGSRAWTGWMFWWWKPKKKSWVASFTPKAGRRLVEFELMQNHPQKILAFHHQVNIELLNHQVSGLSNTGKYSIYRWIPIRPSI